MVGRNCPDRSSESSKKGSILMSEEQKKCDIEAPGHNLPAKLRLGKLRRIKISKTRLELDGDRFLLHRSCQPIRVRCGNRPLFNLNSDPFWTDSHKSDWECFCFERYVIHNPEELIAAMDESGWSNFQEVKSKNLKGLILYFESAKKYFWLQESYFDFGGAQVCTGGKNKLSNQTRLPTFPGDPEKLSELQN
jgi:hypothetical protein